MRFKTLPIFPAFFLMGLADAMGNSLTLVDGLAVIGGGVSAAWPLFLPAVVDELNSSYTGPDGRKFRRLASMAFNLEDPVQLHTFLAGETREIPVPGSRKKIATIRYSASVWAYRAWAQVKPLPLAPMPSRSTDSIKFLRVLEAWSLRVLYTR